MHARAQPTREERRKLVDGMRRGDHPRSVTDRLQLFRAYMERTAAAADPRSAIARGLYVPPPGRSVADQVAGRIELQPASTHLVVGGIGSGKTTQLLVTQERLQRISDMEAIYVDVSRRHDLNKLDSGVLVALAGLSFAKLLADDKSLPVVRAKAFFSKWALAGDQFFRPDDHDHDHDHDNYDNGPPSDDGQDEPGEWVNVPPVLSPSPRAATPSLTSSEGAALKVLTEALRQRLPHIALLVDSLDLIINMNAFEAIVRDDVALLVALGIGVVLVGPLKLLYGTWLPIAAPFDKIYQLSWIDPEEPTGREFLTRVLRARGPENILSDEGAARLVNVCGGVLRDLIGLARDAGEEAYLAGDEIIGSAHADAAADAFGRTLMLGLSTDDLTTLQRVRVQGTFVPVSDEDLALLMSGRVLEYRNGRVRYAVHPTIRPLLEQLAATP